MRSSLAIAAVLMVAGCGSEQRPGDFGGTWVFDEVTLDGRVLKENCCTVRIEQKGDRVSVEAEDREWRCDGRGQVKGNVCVFRWKGEHWRGDAVLAVEGDRIRGIYRKTHERSEPQYVVGRRLGR